MGIFKYLLKVWKNQDDIYCNENRRLRELGGLFITFVICVGFLICPLMRTFLKWIAYFSVVSFAIFILCVFFTNLNELAKSFRYAKKLEKLGTSVEEEEMARRTLCKLEGDDGLPSEKERRNSNFC